MHISEERNTAQRSGDGVFVLLPVLNEIQNIGPLLDQIEEALSNTVYTIGIVDDGSKDGTAEYLERRARVSESRLKLIRRKKTTRGSQRGGALRLLLEWGLNYTSHHIFIEMDGDLSHRPGEINKGIALIRSGSCDVAIASKYVPGSEVVNRPIGRRLVSRICSMAVGMLISRRVRDYSNGYRFYSRQAAELISEHKIRYGSPIYLSEALAIWMRHGMRVTEFPTTYIGRNEGISKLRVSDLVKAGIATFEIAWRYHAVGFGPRASQVLSSNAALEPDFLMAGNESRYDPRSAELESAESHVAGESGQRPLRLKWFHLSRR